jgi:hypothetical protein
LTSKRSKERKTEMTTETTKTSGLFGEVPKNLAQHVRHSRGPTGDVAELSAQAQRLGRALDVAEKWIDAAGQSTEMWHQAEYTRDQLEEELSRVIWEMDVAYDLSEYQRANRIRGQEPDEDGPAKVRAGHLSNTLLDIYCALRVAPEDIFGVGEREAGRRSRYAMMGALLAAMDAASGATSGLDE